MPLTTELVTNPPPGSEWVYAVPGQYIERIFGILATLNTAPPPPLILADASGHARNGTYAGVGPGAITLGVPGMVTGDTAVSLAAQGYPPGFYVDVPNTAFTTSGGAFTVEYWVNGRVRAEFFGVSTTVQLMGCAIDLNLGRQQIFTGNAGDLTAFAPPAAGIPHMVAWRFDGTTYRFYIDGVQISTGNVASIFPWQVPTRYDFSNTSQQFGGGFAGTVLDELAVWSRDIGAARIAAHYAARGTFAGYSAAVLADAPDAYYHLDDVQGANPTRTVALVVTDGRDVIGTYPTLAAVPDSTVEQYTWLPTNSYNVPVPGATVQTVAIPPLVLPSGYTIGTATDQMNVGDQWSDITLWYDYSYTSGGGAIAEPGYRNLLILG